MVLMLYQYTSYTLMLKIISFKDVNARLELQHSYDKDSSHAIKYVGLNAKGTYVVSPNLDIAGKFNFIYQFNEESEFKDLELTGGAFVQHLFLNETDVYSDKFIAYIKKIQMVIKR